MVMFGLWALDSVDLELMSRDSVLPPLSIRKFLLIQFLESVGEGDGREGSGWFSGEVELGGISITVEVDTMDRALGKEDEGLGVSTLTVMCATSIEPVLWVITQSPVIAEHVNINMFTTVLRHSP
ncbi:hypothetical protein AAFF_G00234260 [Aldrovandia affinis]|uniref:Uncharacterized protein n=1 Tax=Aldrovandia affinis TaxID=143900 RepID=A0AAD7WU82_9TELE|nr:hypothetical protein AAFF_G00234260 [Aldrovandia affinis]